MHTEQRDDSSVGPQDGLESQADVIQAPIVVLGPHRSGTSALAGSLVQAGLWLGDVIGPGPDNPLGYHENQQILSAHIDLLLSMQRDWQCPPEWFEASVFDLDPLRRAVEQLAASGLDRSSPWGVKDPRMLYLLPAWCELVPSMRFVGTFRDPRSIADSLVARDGLEHRFAYDLAERQLERLRDLQVEFQFPLIEFGGPADSFTGQLSRLIPLLGLNHDIDPEQAFVPSLVHHRRARSAQRSDVFLELREAADSPPEPAAVSSDVLAPVLRRIARPNRDVPSYHGPGFAARFRVCRDHASEFGVDLAPTWTITPNPTTAESISRPANADGPLAAVIAVGVAEAGGASAIRQTLEAAGTNIGPEAIAVFDGYFVDERPSPHERYWPTSAETTTGHQPPCHVHLDELRAVAAITGWHLATVADIGLKRGRRMATFVTNPERRREERTHGEWRDLVAQRDDTIRRQVGDIEHRDNLIDDMASSSRRQASRIADLETELRDLEHVRRAEYDRLLEDNRALRHWVADVQAVNEAAMHDLQVLEHHHQVTLLSPRQARTLKRLVPDTLHGPLRRAREVLRRLTP